MPGAGGEAAGETEAAPHPRGDAPAREPTCHRSAPGRTGTTGETDGGDDDLENIGERTMVSAQPERDDDGRLHGRYRRRRRRSKPRWLPVRRSRTTSTPTRTDQRSTNPGDDDQEISDDGPTMAREAAADHREAAARSEGQSARPPPALAAKIHAPAVSALTRQPKASRRTPGQGVPSNNVLQAIVGRRRASEPMPVPAAPSGDAPRAEPARRTVPVGNARRGQPAMGYATDASGMPLDAFRRHRSGVPTGPQPHMPAVHACAGHDAAAAMADAADAADADAERSTRCSRSTRRCLRCRRARCIRCRRRIRCSR